MTRGRIDNAGATDVQFCRSAVLEVALSALVLTADSPGTVYVQWVEATRRAVPDVVVAAVGRLAQQIHDPASWWWQFADYPTWPDPEEVTAQLQGQDVSVVPEGTEHAMLQMYQRLVFGARWDTARAELATIWRAQDRVLQRMGSGATVATAHPALATMVGAGRVQLIASAFVWPDPLRVPDPAADGDARIVYGVRGMGNLFPMGGGEDPPLAALQEALGPVRLRLLHVLERPMTVAMLAHCLALPDSTVFTHMRMMQRVGVVRLTERSVKARTSWSVREQGPGQVEYELEPKTRQLRSQLASRVPQ